MTRGIVTPVVVALVAVVAGSACHASLMSDSSSAPPVATDWGAVEALAAEAAPEAEVGVDNILLASTTPLAVLDSSVLSAAADTGQSGGGVDRSAHAPVPEPASCVLLALAAAGVGAGLKRRKK